MTAKIEQEVAKMIADGFDPRMYRHGMADSLKCSVEEWDAAVDRAHAPQCSDGSGIADRSAHTIYAETTGRRLAEEAERAFDRQENEA